MHLGKFHSMIVGDQSKRLYSPQVQARFTNASPENRANKKPYVIGICGGPSSGKSTVANMLKSQLKNYKIQAHLLSLMNYYHPVRGNLRRRSRADSKSHEQHMQLMT